MAVFFLCQTALASPLFYARLDFEAGGRPRSVAIGDLDGDSDLDLAVANLGSNNVSVLLGNGDGTFQGALNSGAGDGPYSVAIGDLDGDNDLDLAVVNAGSGDVSVLLGNGDGTFQGAVNYETGYGPCSVAIGDLDGDCDLDLAVLNAGSGDVSVLINSRFEYQFSGFLPPVSLEQPFTLGCTVPVKFQLTNCTGNYIITALATLTLQQYSGEEPVGDPIGTTFTSAADTGNIFRYDLESNQYIYNLRTNDLQRGTYLMLVALDDGQEQTTFISFK